MLCRMNTGPYWVQLSYKDSGIPIKPPTRKHYFFLCFKKSSTFKVEGSLPSETIYGLTSLIDGTSYIGNFQDSELGIEIKVKSFFDILLNKAMRLRETGIYQYISQC